MKVEESITEPNNVTPPLPSSIDADNPQTNLIEQVQDQAQPQIQPIPPTIVASNSVSPSEATMGSVGNIPSSVSAPNNSTLTIEGTNRNQPTAASTSVQPNPTLLLEGAHFVPEQGGEDLSLNEEDTLKDKKRLKRVSVDSEGRDVNKAKEKIRWKDVWVAQLIHIRGRMHSTFTNPQRQRVDLWQIVEREMTNSCFGFDKDSEACRKKWLRVYKEYKDDLHLSNKDESQKCRFYDLIDFYMGARAMHNNNINNSNNNNHLLHAEVMPISKHPPFPHINEVNVKGEDTGAIILHPNPDGTKASEGVSKKQQKRPRVTEKPLIIEKPQQAPEPAEASSPSTKKAHAKTVHTMLSELVCIGKEMLQTTREYENEKISVLHSMKDMLGRIAKKM